LAVKKLLLKKPGRAVDAKPGFHQPGLLADCDSRENQAADAEY
jgi:hypothetical protein